LTDDILRPDEVARAEALAQNKFASPAWLADVA
jgi:lipoate-protein ligase A